MKRSLIPLFALALALPCHAVPVILGKLAFAGDFTLNHAYNYNDPHDTDFGHFEDQFVRESSGVFGFTVHSGDQLAMNTRFMFGSELGGNVVSPMIWQIGDFRFNTERTLIAGAPQIGALAIGVIDPVSFLGFNLSSFPAVFSYWSFITPSFSPVNFLDDLRGPIALELVLGYEDGRPYPTPDAGSTLLLMGISLCILFGVKNHEQRQA